MKIFTLYEHLLEEEVVTKNSEGCVAKFGRELFADQLGGDEPNTKIENEFAKMIHKFTETEYGEDVSPKFIKAMKNLQTCMSAYPEILHPSGQYVYRGTVIPFKYFFSKYKTVTDQGDFNYIYKPRGIVQSWTEDRDTGINYAFGKDYINMNRRLQVILKDISTPDYDEKTDKEKIDYFIKELNYQNFLTFRIPVMLTHEATPQSFLFKGKYFAQLSKFPDESEILRVGNSPITCIGKVHEMIPKLCSELNRLKKGIDIRNDDFID